MSEPNSDNLVTIKYLHGQISERSIMLRQADRAMLKGHVRSFLPPRTEAAFLFLRGHRFVYHHFALPYTIITGLSL